MKNPLKQEQISKNLEEEENTNLSLFIPSYLYISPYNKNKNTYIRKLYLPYIILFP